MNKIYRVVFNEVAGVWQAVAEVAAGRGKRASGRAAVVGAGGAAPARRSARVGVALGAIAAAATLVVWQPVAAQSYQDGTNGAGGAAWPGGSAGGAGGLGGGGGAGSADGSGGAGGGSQGGAGGQGQAAGTAAAQAQTTDFADFHKASHWFLGGSGGGGGSATSVASGNAGGDGSGSFVDTSGGDRTVSEGVTLGGSGGGGGAGAGQMQGGSGGRGGSGFLRLSTTTLITSSIAIGGDGGDAASYRSGQAGAGGDGWLDLNGGAAVRASGRITVGGAVGKGDSSKAGAGGNGVLSFRGAGTVAAANGILVRANGRIEAMHSTGVARLEADISGAGTFTQTGAGTTVLTGNNTYTGGSTVNAGILALSGAGRLASTAPVALTGDTAVFSIAAADGGRTIGALSGVTGSTVALGANTLAFGTATNQTFAGAIGGAGGSIVKNGGGTATLSGASTFTGGTTVNAGTLAIGHMGALGTGDVTLNNGAELLSTVSGTETFGRLVVTSNNGRVSAATGTTFDVRGFDLEGTTLRIGSSGNAGTVSLTSLSGSSTTAPNNLAIDHGTLRYGDSLPASALTTYGGRLSVAEGATADLNGLAVRTTFLDGAGRIENQKAGSAASLTVGVHGPSASTGSTFSGVIADGAGAGVVSLVKEDANTLSLAGANSYTGGTTVNGGTLAIGHMGALGTGDVTLNNGAELLSTVSGADTFGRLVVTSNGRVSAATGTTLNLQGFSLLGTLHVGSSGNAGVVSLSNGDSASLEAPTNLAVDHGTFRYGTGYFPTVLTSAGGRLTVAAGATADLNGFSINTTFLDGAGRIESQKADSPASLTVGVSSPDASVASAFSGVIADGQGVVSLIKEGVNTLTLTGTNTYTGGTTVNGGTLAVGSGGVGSVTGHVQVNTGGTLGGSGRIGGNVAVASGGTLAPGNSPGTLTVDGNLTLAAGSTTRFELGQSGAVGGVSNDLVRVGGNLALNGSLQASAASAGWYRLFNYGEKNGSGQLSGGFDAATSSVTMGGVAAANYQLSSTAAAAGTPGQVNLSVTGAGQTLQFWNGGNETSTPTWQGGTGTWAATGTNWLNEGAPGGPDVTQPAGWANSVAVFGGSAGTVSVQGDVAFDTLQFSTDGYNVAAASGGGALVIAPAASSAVAPHGTINTDAGVNASIAAVITNSGGAQNGLITTGSGTLTLSGANTYSGGTTVNAGTLVAASNGALGTAAVVVDNSGGHDATLRVVNGVTLGNAITLSHGAVLDNQGTVRGLDGSGAVQGGLGNNSVRNHAGGLIEGFVAAGVRLGNGGTVRNEGTGMAYSTRISGALGVQIEGAPGTVTNTAGGQISGVIGGVVLDAGGTVDNQGMGTSILGEAVGVGIANGAGTVNNIGGGSIGGWGTSGTGVSLVGGGSLVNGEGSSISGSLASVLAGAETTLRNAGTLIGAVRLADVENHVALVSGGVILGALDIGNQAASTLTLDGAATTQKYSAAVTGATTFAGGLIKDGAGTWVLDTDLSGAYSASIRQGILQIGDGGTAGALGGASAIAVSKGAELAVNRSDPLHIGAAISGEGALRLIGPGTTTLSGDNSYSGGTAVKAGTLAVGSSTALGTGSLRMDDDTTLAFAADGLTLANPIVFTGSTDPTFDTGAHTATLTGGISGAADLTKTGSGTLVFGAANNTYSGATTVAQGSLRAGAANAFSAASLHTVASGATLDLAGFSQTLPGLTNAGTVNLRGPAPGATLTVTGPWVGQGGTLAVGTALGNDASVADRLLLSGAGAVASGSTLLQVTNVGGLGARTTGQGIAVVATADGGRIEGQAFTLAAPVAAGAYEYRLDTTPTGAYLSNTLPPAPTPDPVPGPGPTPDAAPAISVPTYRAEVPLYAALPQQLRQASLGMLGSRLQRTGEEDNASAPGERSPRQAWGRVISLDRDLQQSGSVSPTSRGRLNGFQAGTDLWANAQWKAGLYAGQLDGDMQVNGFARGVQNLAAGRNDLRSQFLGGYASWQHSDGLYVDGVIQAGRHRYTAGTSLATQSGGKGDSLLASIEVGKAWAVAPGWQVEPQLQLVHQRLRLDDSAIAGATTVRQRLHDGWQARLGVRVKGEIATGAGLLQPYARVNVYRAGGGTDHTRFAALGGATDIVTRTGGTSTELAAGATWQVTPAWSVYGEVAQLWGSGGDARTRGGVNGSLGVKMKW